MSRAIGSTIRQAREAKGLSRIQFAQKVGASPASVWNWEQEETAPRAKAIPRIASVLGLDPSRLTPGGRRALPKTSSAAARGVGRAGGPKVGESASLREVIAGTRREISRITGFPEGEIHLNVAFDP